MLPILLSFLEPSSIHQRLTHCSTFTQLLNPLVLSRHWAWSSRILAHKKSLLLLLLLLCLCRFHAVCGTKYYKYHIKLLCVSMLQIFDRHHKGIWPGFSSMSFARAKRHNMKYDGTFFGFALDAPGLWCKLIDNALTREISGPDLFINIFCGVLQWLSVLWIFNLCKCNHEKNNT